MDCIDWKGGPGPTEYQLEIISELQKRKRAAVRGPHGLGKTALASWVILAFALTRDGTDWKIPTTASAWRQLTKYLWPELHKWSRRIRWDQVGRDTFRPRDEMLTLSLKMTTGEAFAVASDQPELIEGAHADSLLYVFDESKSVQDATFDAAEGAFSGGGVEGVEAYALAISTPGEPTGRFYDIHKRKPGYDDWWVRHVRLDEAIKAGRISQEWADQRKLQWGENSAVFQNRVIGEFAANEEDSIIPLAWIERANDRWRAWQDEGFPGTFFSVGVDIGGGGESGDQTVLALCLNRHQIKELRKFPRGDVETATMETAGRIKGILDVEIKRLEAETPVEDSEDEESPKKKRKKGHPFTAVIDVIGIGAGVYHRLREQGYQMALGFKAAEKAQRIVNGKPADMEDTTGEFRFVNKRAAAWWAMRELLNPLDGVDVALPPDDQLTGELTAPKYKVMSGARIQVESKVDIRKRIKRSTDNADAVIQAIVGPEVAEPPKQWRKTKFVSV